MRVNPASQPQALNTVTIEAFTGPDGTGSSLGTFSNSQFNFQPNHLYFMGVVSTDHDIGSLVFTTEGDVADEIGRAPKDKTNNPLTPVLIKRVTRIEPAADAKESTKPSSSSR